MVLLVTKAAADPFATNEASPQFVMLASERCERKSIEAVTMSSKFLYSVVVVEEEDTVEAKAKEGVGGRRRRRRGADAALLPGGRTEAHARKGRVGERAKLALENPEKRPENLVALLPSRACAQRPHGLTTHATRLRTGPEILAPWFRSPVCQPVLQQPNFPRLP